MGKRVLLVDCDASTNGLTLLFLSKVLKSRAGEGFHAGIFELDQDSIYALGRNLETNPLGSIPQVVNLDPNLDLLPATFLMQNTENVATENFEASLNWLLKAAHDHYDYVFFDAQAGVDAHAEVAIRLADKVVILSEYDPISASGVERLKRLLAPALEGRDIWTLYNKVLPEFADMRSDFLEVVGLLPPVAWDADVIRAFTRRRLAVNTKEGNPHTFALLAVLEPLFSDTLEETLAEWREKKDNFLRLPIKQRVTELTNDVEVVERAMATMVERKSRGLFLIPTKSPIFAAIFSILICVLLIAAGFLLIFSSGLPRVYLYALYAYLVGFTVPILAAVIAKSPFSKSNRYDSASERQGRYALERQRDQLVADIYRYQQVLKMDTSKLSGLSPEERALTDRIISLPDRNTFL